MPLVATTLPRTLRALALSIGLLASAAAGAPALAGPVNEEGGVAIKGTDPVAYFTEGRPVAGSPDHTFEHEGAVFRFASAANRDAFAADPARYAPQYGGFCAFATAKGVKAGIDPEAFAIVNGKLYLNYNEDIQTEWSQDVPGQVAKADANWPTVKGLSEVYR